MKDKTSYRVATMNAVSVAPIGALSFGWFPMQGEDYALGFEARGQVAHYSEGVEFGLDLVLVAKLMH